MHRQHFGVGLSVVDQLSAKLFEKYKSLKKFRFERSLSSRGLGFERKVKESKL